MSLMFFNAEQHKNVIPLITYEDETRCKHIFSVISHAFLFLLRQKKLSSDLGIYNNLLARHAEYFPKQLPVHIQKQKASEQFQYLVTYTQPLKEVLEPALAYTLQQMVVDVMCEKPERYGALFLEGHEPKALRKANNLDNPAVIQILASEILHINIYVERHAENYFLPVREYYLPDAKSSAEMHIQFKDKYYITQSDINELESEVA